MITAQDIPPISYTAVVYKEGYNYLGVRFEYVPRQEVMGQPPVQTRVAVEVKAVGDWDTKKFWKRVKQKLWR